MSSRASDRTAYYSAYAHSAAARAVHGAAYGTRSCDLRIVPPGVSLDQGWEVVDLSALAGGRPAGEFVLASDSVGYFRAYYAEELGVTAESWQDDSGTPAYPWWRWEIGAPSAEETGQALTVEAAHYTVGGRVYVGNPSADWSKTTRVQLSESGALRAGLTVTGRYTRRHRPGALTVSCSLGVLEPALASRLVQHLAVLLILTRLANWLTIGACQTSRC